MSRLFAVALAAAVVVACSDPVRPTGPSEALAAKGGTKGPNKLHFVFEYDEWGDPTTACNEQFPDCVFMVAGLRKPQTLTVKMTVDVFSAWDCLGSEEWEDDLPSASAIYSGTYGPVSGSKSYAGSLSLWGAVERAMTCPAGRVAELFNISAISHTLTAIAGKDTASVTFVRGEIVAASF